MWNKNEYVLRKVDKFSQSAEKVSMPFISGKGRKVFYKFPDDLQMTDKYSNETKLVQGLA